MSISRPFKTRQLEALQDAEQAALYLEEALEAGDMGAFKLALRNVAEAHGGISKLAENTDLNRENLYRVLSSKGNPNLSTLNKVLHALGLRISVTIDEEDRPTQAA